ncbi:hypothetical protein F5Y03DRAFT_393223 [Xylaria venustula]|nr:hypothetical protein F5Y03DRAFT_393223 [Xylaria venustula]
MFDVRQTRDESSNVIELYFDLEKASERFNGEKVDDEIRRFIDITGQNEDPRIQMLAETAAQRDNATGGKGLFVFPHSPSVFMGVEDQPAEQPVAEAQATPEPPIKTQREGYLDHGLQAQRVGAMASASYWGYNAQIQGYEALLASPSVYHTQGQLNSQQDPQVRQFEAPTPRLPIAFHTQHQNLPYRSQVPEAQYTKQGSFFYARNVTSPEPEATEDYEVEEVMDAIETEGPVKYLVMWED